MQAVQAVIERRPVRRSDVMCALAALIAGCGGSSGPAPAPPAAATEIATPRLAPDDLEVATVNGRPVWASCVTIQSRNLVARSADQRRASALDQCIAFELLAQAAAARGLAAAPEVVDATRAAEVNRLVETDFEQHYRSPDDLKPQIDVVMKKNEWRMHILELRSSTFARFVVPKAAPAELDAKAHALADRLAAQLAGETGLFNVHLTSAAERIADGAGVKLETADVKPTHHDDLVDAYAAALYAIPAVGRISPAFRSPWGWDVVLWTGGVEAKEHPRDEIVGEMFPELRRRQFQLWVAQLAKQRGIHVELTQANIDKLDTGEPP